MGGRIGELPQRVQFERRERTERYENAAIRGYSRPVYEGFQRCGVGSYYRCDNQARTAALAGIAGLLIGAAVANRQAQSNSYSTPAAPPPPPVYDAGGAITSNLAYPAAQIYASLMQTAMQAGRSDVFMSLQTMSREPAFTQMSPQGQSVIMNMIAANPSAYNDIRGAMYLCRSRGTQGALDRALMDPGFQQRFQWNPHMAAQMLG